MTAGQAWRADAPCASLGDYLFFPDADAGTSNVPNYKHARAVCDSCPVWQPCRLAGMGEAGGMWGGMTPVERRRVRARAGWAESRFAELDDLRRQLTRALDAAGGDVAAALEALPAWDMQPALHDYEVKV